MNLQELKMNRFMYRSAPIEEDDSAQYMSSAIYSGKEQASKQSSEKNKKDAREIITGTIITACLIKSSDQDDRLEIGQNLQAALGTSDSPFPVLRSGDVDYLAAYFHGNATFILTGQGYIYFNFVQQADKWVNLENALVIQNLSTPMWTVTHLGTGRYQVNHNIGNMFYSAMAIPAVIGSDAPYFAMISDKNEDSFVINIYEAVTAGHVDYEWNCQVFINPS